MNIFKKLFPIAMAATLVLTGCGSGAGGQSSSKSAAGSTAANASASASSEDTSGKKEILFWHSMSGANEDKILKVVNGFNKSQDKYVVKAQNQGKYDESTSKFFQMNGGKGAPALIQIGEQNLQSMVDSKLIANVSDLIKKYNYPKDDLVPGVANFYTLNGSLYAMPFNASSPVLYYNVEALKKAGYDKAPKTFEEIVDSVDKIEKANNGMLPFGMHAYGYALDQMVTNLGGLVVNNENGRAGRATEVAYQPQLKVIFDFIHKLVDKKAFTNYGTGADNVVTDFNEKKIAMFITSSASAASIIKNAKFEVGIAYLPTEKGVEPQGVYGGGGAICVSKGLDPDTEKGVMEFLTYATSPEVQAVWAGDTGYFPINTKAYDTKTMKEIYAKTPQLEVAANQFRGSKQTPATAGPVLSQLPQLRNDMQAAFESVANGQDPQTAIDNAAKSTNAKIEAANRAVGK